MTRSYDLEHRLIEFGVSVCGIADGLPHSRVGSHVAGQLVRCGTSPAPNYGEAQGAESRKDFLHKLKICLKELRESMVWLKFIRHMKLQSHARLDPVLQEANELISVFVASIKTTERST